MPKPTQEQLDKINRFAIEPLTEDEVYVFPDLMIDDQPTAYSSKIHENLLRKFVVDAKRGVGLLMNHNSRSLPVGRSFDADLREEVGDDGKLYKSIYGQFYIDLGRQTESGMTTDDLVKGINSGTIFDTSIGFNANSWDCSICSYDIRDWRNCSHYPGEKYQVEGANGVHSEETCYVIAGADGGGELLENSLVYAGAVDRATIKRNFSVSDVRETEKGSNLHMVESFKNVPTNATIYQYFAKDGSALFFTETDERTNGLEELKKRSEQEVEFAVVKEAIEKFGIKFENVDELSAGLENLSKQAQELTQKDEKITELSNKVSGLESDLSTKDETIQELTIKNEELTEKAGLAETYRQDLTAKALEAGVRAQGNAFQKGMYEKFLGTLSIDEIKEVIEGFDKEVADRFAGARHTQPNGEVTRHSTPAEPKTAEDFEDETEFRNKVADEAMQYSKDNGVSVKEAMKVIYQKYTAGSEE